ncbi:hypothetical protein K501DRAFT_286208 [Backusella circina FSU 941]|nr:hypothetical protein K501DRAFT_286208 [Backusella circina FSU 941]
MNKSGIGNESESAIVDACSLANRLEEQQDKYNTLYTTFKEIKDKEIKFDYCPNAEEKYVDSLVSIRILMNSMKEDLDGLEYLIQQKAEMITGEKLDELEQERYRGYLRDIEAHNEGIKRLENDIKSLPYLKETYNLLEPIPKFQKKLAMDFQVKESNINFIGEYTKVNKKLERARKQWLYSKIHLFIQDVMHDQLEINARSIIRRETAVIIQDMKKIIPTVTSTSTNKKGNGCIVTL